MVSHGCSCVCLFVCLIVCLFVCLFVCLLVVFCFFLFVVFLCLFVCLFVFVFVCVCVCSCGCGCGCCCSCSCLFSCFVVVLVLVAVEQGILETFQLCDFYLKGCSMACSLCFLVFCCFPQAQSKRIAYCVCAVPLHLLIFCCCAMLCLYMRALSPTSLKKIDHDRARVDGARNGVAQPDRRPNWSRRSKPCST